MVVGPGQPGDSGSVLFDSKTGRVIGIITYGFSDGLFMGVFPIQFTQAQVVQALQSVSTVDEPKPRPAEDVADPIMFPFGFID